MRPLSMAVGCSVFHHSSDSQIYEQAARGLALEVAKVESSF